MRICSKVAVLIVASLWVGFCVSSAFAQSTNAELSGRITDPNGLQVPKVKIEAVNVLTNVAASTETNEVGLYTFVSLQPGIYRVVVQKEGFDSIVKPDVELHVEDHVVINFALRIGSITTSVTVEGGAPLINTQDASVSTVVDRQFVENMPLNGRSFQTLIALTPGVVLTPVTVGGEQGQFSVNGQRANANYFTVDGVSANVGTVTGSIALNQSVGGSLPALSALGGTNSLVSVDAMQEFRIQTSSFAPEFGRSPGGQVSIATRSGTNDLHGTAFEYFRNDVLDANDWFSNRNGLPKPAERQNDFGGVIGGPIAKDKTFFFFSYEGLRLRQPLSQETVVPDSASRQAAPAAIQPFLNVFPISNGPQLGAGLAQFNGSYSNPSTLDAYSFRMDHTINSKLTIFGRYNYSPSDAVLRGANSVLSNTQAATFSTQTFTLGLAESMTKKVSNEVRANYSNVRAGSKFNLDTFGGAVPLPDSLMFPTGYSSANGTFEFDISNVGVPSAGNLGISEQRQVNFVDNLSLTTGAHQMKFGVDYRWLSPFTAGVTYTQFAFFSGVTGPGGAVSGVAPFVAVDALQPVALLTRNFSLYGQDTWKATPRLTFTYGLRWDINPAPKGKNSANDLFTVLGLDNPATMTLAPRGTPLYSTTYGNVAPRLGVAYQLKQGPSWGQILRGGFGVFYDLGSGGVGAATANFPFFAFKSLSNVPFPLTAQEAAPPLLSTNPPVSNIIVTESDLKLPRTYQWNVAVEQSFGASQTLSITYLGALGRDLLRQDALAFPNADFGFVAVTRNTATSDYNALQLKFQRRLSRGLQALASYTFSHSLDIASSDMSNFNTPGSVANPNVDRGNSNFDVRHSFSGALTYDVPAVRGQKLARAIIGNWSLDSFVMARSAVPVDLIGGFSFGGGTVFQARPNLVTGMPLYLSGAQYPGGKAFNPAAFSPAPNLQQGDFGRNVVRGFGAWQADFAVRRQFHLTERIGLQFRTEFFNIFNHPNFGNPNNILGNPLFGQSTQTLASSLGSGGANGGFNPLYQIGGPRSVQLALKIQF